MCGFVGIATSNKFSPTEQEGILERMSTAIQHRGPNSSGHIKTDSLSAKFLRLSIQDLNNGDQPIHNETGSVSVFLNGEIYNHLELRKELETLGHQLQSHSDAEVLPHLYEEFGIDFLSKLNGMFSILLVDRENNKSYLCRDPMGIKPLYYKASDDLIIFGSELKAILASELFSPTIDAESAIEYINFFYCSDPRTMVKDVFKVPAGSYIEIDQTLRPSIKPFYSFPHRQQTRLVAPDLEELEDLLYSAVDLQLAADVPVGISLSGGLDSSLLALLASRSQRSSEVSAFTIHFDGTPDEEANSARKLATDLGLAHKVFTATATHFLENAAYMTWISDEPIADPAFFAAQLVAEIASKEVTVILSGAGADELFAGYGHHKLSKRNALAESILRKNIPFAKACLSAAFDDDTLVGLASYESSRLPWHLRCASNLSSSDYRHLAYALGVSTPASSPLEKAYMEAPLLDSLNQQLYCDTTRYLRSQLLPLQDRTTMAASIEGRVPFLDHRVIEYAFKIDGKSKIENGCSKKILKDLARKVGLPSAIIDRKKLGFPNAVQEWFSGTASKTLESVLLHPTSYSGQHLAPWVKEKLRTKESIQNNWKSLYALFILDIWNELFINRKQWSRPHLTINELFDI